MKRIILLLITLLMLITCLSSCESKATDTAAKTTDEEVATQDKDSEKVDDEKLMTTEFADELLDYVDKLSVDDLLMMGFEKTYQKRGVEYFYRDNEYFFLSVCKDEANEGYETDKTEIEENIAENFYYHKAVYEAHRGRSYIWIMIKDVPVNKWSTDWFRNQMRLILRDKNIEALDNGQTTLFAKNAISNE